MLVDFGDALIDSLLIMAHAKSISTVLFQKIAQGRKGLLVLGHKRSLTFACCTLHRRIAHAAALRT